MNTIDRIQEILDTYQKYGWKIERVLMRPETLEVVVQGPFSFADARIEEGSINALWFSRASHNDRDAWELRLVAESNYALFETFEVDESEEERKEVRREMEARMREYVNREPGEVKSDE